MSSAGGYSLAPEISHVPHGQKNQNTKQKIKTFKVVLAKQTSKKVDQDKKENKWQVL